MKQWVKGIIGGFAAIAIVFDMVAVVGIAIFLFVKFQIDWSALLVALTILVVFAIGYVTAEDM